MPPNYGMMPHHPDLMNMGMNMPPGMNGMPPNMGHMMNGPNEMGGMSGDGEGANGLGLGMDGFPQGGGGGGGYPPSGAMMGMNMPIPGSEYQQGNNMPVRYHPCFQI